MTLNRPQPQWEPSQAQALRMLMRTPPSRGQCARTAAPTPAEGAASVNRPVSVLPHHLKYGFNSFHNSELSTDSGVLLLCHSDRHFLNFYVLKSCICLTCPQDLQKTQLYWYWHIWSFPKGLTFIPPPQDPTKKPWVHPNEMQ